MYTYTHLEDFIQEVFRKLNISSPSELNPYFIADSLGIGLYPISTESQAIQFEGKQYIFLNNRLTSHERFEMFAHELGHILLHTGNQKHMQKDYRSYQEWKADLFALHFCVPTFMLQELTVHQLDPQKISRAFGVTYDFACKRLTLYRQRIFQQQSMKISKRRI